MSRVEQLSGADDARAVSGDDPFVEQLLAYRTGGLWACGRAVAVAMSYLPDDDGQVVVVGPAVDAAELLVGLAPEPGSQVSLPVGVAHLIEGTLPFALAAAWAFRWTDRPTGFGTVAANWLGDDESGDVNALLDAAFPDAAARPGSPRARRWAGLRDGGVLVACAADGTASPRLGFLASVAVHPGLRGIRLGTGISAWLTDALLAELPRVGLWHMASNLRADAVYGSLGYRDEHRMQSLMVRP